MKAIAIISVVAAHTASYGGEDAGVLQLYLANIGTVGVIVFFSLSGYLFHNEGIFDWSFWKKKAVRLCIPWLVFLTAGYFKVGMLYKPANISIWLETARGLCDFKAWVRYVLGFGTYAYYMSMLFCCYILFSVIGRNIYAVFIFSFASLLLSRIHCIVCFGRLTPYMNPISWIGWFGIGLLFCNYKDNTFVKYIKLISEKCRFVFSVVGTFLPLLSVFCNIRMDYWKVIFIPFVVLECIATYSSAIIIEKTPQIISKAVVYLGKDSFYIYLIHMIFQSIPYKFLQKAGSFGILIRPIFLTVVVWIPIRIIRILTVKIMNRNLK